MTENTQHLSIHAPSWAPHQEPSQERALIACDLCGEDKPATQFSQAAHDVSGVWACTTCVETELSWKTN